MLTAYRVYLSNGTNYVTSMAQGVTLEQAQAYFVGQSFEIDETKPTVQAVKVEVA